MEKEQLIDEIRSKKSMLCVGLDTDIERLPNGLSKDGQGVLKFNKAIIEATSKYAVAYKLNTAFYEQYGAEGWEIMEETLKAIPSECFTIADAKRGDIGNTSKMYAKAFLEKLPFDSITVAPYMGSDSISPFYQYDDKWVICLGLTSNQGSEDFQLLETPAGLLHEVVMEKVATWGSDKNTMFVVGATKSDKMKFIRQKFPNHFFLVPGVGAQGGDLEEVCASFSNEEGGLLINSSRGIIYASSKENYAEAAAMEAARLQGVMANFL